MSSFIVLHALAATLGLGAPTPETLVADTLVRPWVQVRHLPPSHTAPAPFPVDSSAALEPARLHLLHRRDREHNAPRPLPRTTPASRPFTPSATR